jgi:hypothetical protein
VTALTQICDRCYLGGRLVQYASSCSPLQGVANSVAEEYQRQDHATEPDGISNCKAARAPGGYDGASPVADERRGAVKVCARRGV